MRLRSSMLPEILSSIFVLLVLPAKSNGKSDAKVEMAAALLLLRCLLGETRVLITTSVPAHFCIYDGSFQLLFLGFAPGNGEVMRVSQHNLGFGTIFL